MASTRRKSAAIALAVVGVAGLSLASAAQLTLGSASLGAGSQDVGSCDTDGVAVAFVPTLSGGVYAAGSVELSDVSTLCAGQTYRIVLKDDGGAVLGSEVTGTVTGTTITAAVPGVAAADVAGIDVVIHSAGA